VFTELECAHYWHLKPSEFDNCSEQDKQRMLAYMIEVGEMDAVEAYEAEQKRKKAEAKIQKPRGRRY
jgi:hypothetical protein